MKIVLAGSPSISLKAFEAIINHFDVLAIITQPDQPQGRGLYLKPTPVALLGQKYGIKVFKPQKIIQIYSQLKSLNYDLLLTFAFGQFIPSKILSLGHYSPLNIHGSLLPKYRGAAPIHHAILNGDQELGISLMVMTRKMDAGPIYFQATQAIDCTTTTGEGFKIIAKLAASKIVSWLQMIKKREVSPWDQSGNFSLAPKITKQDGLLKSTLKTSQALRIIKGFNPYPGAFIIIDSKRLKVFAASLEKKYHSIPLTFVDGVLYAYDFQWASKKRVQL